MEDMSDKELLQKNIEEFSRLQNYMSLVDKSSEVYKAMKAELAERAAEAPTVDTEPVESVETK